MLAKRLPLPARGEPRAKQRGVVLMIALIMLVAMTLAGIALVRSVDTANIIAGNMAFRQAAIHSGDSGIETAVNWLVTNNTGTTLQSHNYASGYAASRQDPAASQSWDDFWTAVLASRAVTLSTDASGNTVSYAIQRLCNAVGDPTSVGVDCAVSPVSSSSSGGSKGAGVIALQYSNQVYYRITSRIAGPRNTISYVQAIVAM